MAVIYFGRFLKTIKLVKLCLHFSLTLLCIIMVHIFITVRYRKHKGQLKCHYISRSYLIDLFVEMCLQFMYSYILKFFLRDFPYFH
jgi:hypothetical protein